MRFINKKCLDDKDTISRCDRNKWAAIPILLIIAAFIASLGYGFVSDDRAFLINNPKLLQPVSDYFRNGVWEFSTIQIDGNQLYRPVALLNYRFQSALWGASPAGYHLINVLVHIIVTIFVFYLLSLLVPNASGKTLAIATSLFAVHPVQVESVCWILGNNDLWAALWSFMSILLIIYAVDKNKPFILLAAAFAILAAMLTKEVAYMYPGFVALIIYGLKKRFNQKQAVGIIALSIILLAAVLLLRRNAVESPNIVFELIGVKKLIIYFIGYLKMMIVPLPQRFYLIEPESGVLKLWEMFIGLMVIIGYSLLIWRIKGGRKIFIISALWCGLVLTPALALALHATRATFASRVMYLAIFSLSIILSWLMTNGTIKRRRFVQMLSIVIIVIFTILSLWTGQSWKNQFSFLQLAMTSTPNNIELNIDLGDFYFESGKINEAINAYNLVKNTNASRKSKIMAHERLGEIYAKENIFEKARREFNAILRIDSHNANAYNGLGNISWLSGDLLSAKKYYETALMYNSELTVAKNNLDRVRQLLLKQ